MVPFGTENALSQKGTRARRLFRLGLTPLFLALVCPTPATLKKIRDFSQSTKSPKIYWRWYGGGKFLPRQHTNVCKISRVCGAIPSLDCEQSLFFFRFSKGSARARERRSREKRETSRAISHARGPLRVSQFARRTTEKRETARSLLFFFRAISHARGHLRVSRFARRTTERRETARSLYLRSLLTYQPWTWYVP